MWSVEVRIKSVKRLKANCAGLCLMASLVLVASCLSDKDPAKRGVATIEVAVTDKDGRTQPVAKEMFRLLTGNMIDLLGGNSNDPNGAKKLWAVADDPDPEAVIRVHKVFLKHVLSSATTDAQGKAKFGPVFPGTYYILGWTSVGQEDEIMIWNYKIEVKPGEQKFILNSSNAATVAPAATPTLR